MDSNLVLWSGVVGFFMPILISIVQQPKWSTQVRAIVMFIASAVAALGTVWLEGSFNTTDLVTSALTVLTVTIATYQGFWKPTTVAPKIELATSPGSSTDPAS